MGEFHSGNACRQQPALPTRQQSVVTPVETLARAKCILMYAFNFSEQQHLEVEFIAILSALLRILGTESLRVREDRQVTDGNDGGLCLE
jgi:hypothetical protein